MIKQVLQGDYADFMDINGLIEQYGYALVMAAWQKVKPSRCLAASPRIRGY
jgi:hypothetical protein